jgi:hypothetical protein
VPTKFFMKIFCIKYTTPVPRTSASLVPQQLPYQKRGAHAIATKNPVSKGVRNLRDTGSAASAALVDENKPLTAQQLAFVKAWASGESIASASQRAGYSAGDGFCYRMARMPNVLKIYNAEKARYEESCQMTRKRVMDGLLEGIAMAKLMSEPMSMISGWREVGKMCGYYEPVKHTVDVTVRGEVTLRQMTNMSDADLLKLITGAEEPALLGMADEPEG